MSMSEKVTETLSGQAHKPAWKRYVPIIVIAMGAITGLIFARDYLSFQTLVDNRDALLEWRNANLIVAALVYISVYIVAVAFSVPGAVWLTIGGGFLFGSLGATSLTIVGATTGAALIFLAAKSSLGATLHEKAGPWLQKIEREFHDGEISFLLILRLVPIVPFFIANLAPAFLNVRFRNFLWTTLFGIIPGTAVFASIGAGLGEVLDQGKAPDLGVIFAPHILGPLLGLAVLASLPVVFRKLRRQRD